MGMMDHLTITGSDLNRIHPNILQEIGIDEESLLFILSGTAKSGLGNAEDRIRPICQPSKNDGSAGVSFGSPSGAPPLTQATIASTSASLSRESFRNLP